MPTNNIAPWTSPSFDYTGVPDPTGNLVPAQSPSGAIRTDVNRSESATETRLSAFGESQPQQGTLAVNAPQTFSGQAWAQGNVFRWQ